MATYCYRCQVCGESRTTNLYDVELLCPRWQEHGEDDAVTMRRDYRAENVGVAVAALQRERERGGASAVRDLFLPTAKELAGPGDPDGTKAIHEWNETHDPKPGNSRPMRPDSPRKVF